MPPGSDRLERVLGLVGKVYDAALDETLWTDLADAVPISQGELGVLGIHRPRANGVYDDQDRALVSYFLPHLQRALQLRRRLAELGMAAGAASDVSDRSGAATLVVTRDGRVLYANREAERLLWAGAGIGVIGGRLATGHAATTNRLMALIRNAVDIAAGHGGAAPGRAFAIARDDRLPLTVLVAPFRPVCDGFGAAIPAAILFLRDPERPTPMSLSLQGLFGLTPAESAVAALLADGRSIDDIATRQRISLNTTRVHLKSIFAKTGTARQAQLVALILRSVAAMEAPDITHLGDAPLLDNRYARIPAASWDKRHPKAG